jgi:hypothetical protein
MVRVRIRGRKGKRMEGGDKGKYKKRKGKQRKTEPCFLDVFVCKKYRN